MYSAILLDNTCILSEYLIIHVFYYIVVAVCDDIPANFLPYGPTVGDTEILMEDLAFELFEYASVPFNMFGWTGPGTVLTLFIDVSLCLKYCAHSILRQSIPTRMSLTKHQSPYHELHYV
jgi:hypothetical protein